MRDCKGQKSMTTLINQMYGLLAFARLASGVLHSLRAMHQAWDYSSANAKDGEAWSDSGSHGHIAQQDDGIVGRPRQSMMSAWSSYRSAVCAQTCSKTCQPEFGVCNEAYCAVRRLPCADSAADFAFGCLTAGLSPTASFQVCGTMTESTAMGEYQTCC